MKVLVLGADFASCILANAIRKNRYDAEVILLSIGDEFCETQDGVLSVYSGKCTLGQSRLMLPEYLAAYNICIEPAASISKIDLKQRQIKTVKKLYSADFIVLNHRTVSNLYQRADLSAEITGKRVAVVGAGIFGSQIASNLADRNDVTLYEQNELPCAERFDPEFSYKMAEIMQGYNVRFEHYRVKKIEPTKVVTDSGVLTYDHVIDATMPRPDEKTAQMLRSQLEMSDDMVLIDRTCKTTAPNVFCIGGGALVRGDVYNPSDEYAMRQALCVASSIACGVECPLQPQMLCFSMKIGGKCFLSVGKPAHVLPCERVRVTDNHRAEFMETYEVVSLQLNYSELTRYVMGCQCYSGKDVSWLANSISIAAQRFMTVEQLLVCDFFFQPYFGKPWNIINLACMATHGLPPFEQYRLRRDGQDEID